jgi:hypothetical protein
LSNEDYRQGYKDGWKDGYEQARKDHLPITYPYSPINNPIIGSPTKCALCGLPWSELTNYVCPRAGCPSKVICAAGQHTEGSSIRKDGEWIMRPGGRPTQVFSSNYTETAIKDPGED